MASTDVSASIAGRESSSRAVSISKTAGLLVALAVLALIGLLSLRIGSIEISTRDAWDALFNYNSQEYNQMVVRTLRLPRTLIAIAVGGGLAVAGAVMQSVTRNPLASPSILGVSSGASFAIVTAIFFLGLTTPAQYMWFGFAGAIGASAVVFAVGSAGRGGASPIKLALAGVIISALLGAWTSTLILLDEETLNVVRFWTAGSVAGRDLNILFTVSPFLVGGTLATMFIGHQLNVLDLGDDTARSLGMNTTRVRALSSILVVLITGAAVSVAGPIGFVGLATPHIVRAIIGPDYRWVLPYSLVVGAMLLTTADILGRVIARPGEIQVGIMTALVGAPFLVYLARQSRVLSSK